MDKSRLIDKDDLISNTLNCTPDDRGTLPYDNKVDKIRREELETLKDSNICENEMFKGEDSLTNKEISPVAEDTLRKEHSGELMKELSDVSGRRMPKKNKIISKSAEIPIFLFVVNSGVAPVC